MTEQAQTEFSARKASYEEQLRAYAEQRDAVTAQRQRLAAELSAQQEAAEAKLQQVRARTRVKTGGISDATHVQYTKERSRLQREIAEALRAVEQEEQIVRQKEETLARVQAEDQSVDFDLGDEESEELSAREAELADQLIEMRSRNKALLGDLDALQKQMDEETAMLAERVAQLEQEAGI